MKDGRGLHGDPGRRRLRRGGRADASQPANRASSVYVDTVKRGDGTTRPEITAHSGEVSTGGEQFPAGRGDQGHVVEAAAESTPTSGRRRTLWNDVIAVPTLARRDHGDGRHFRA